MGVSPFFCPPPGPLLRPSVTPGGKYFLWDIVDPRTESNPEPNPEPNPNPKPNPNPNHKPNPNPNPEPNCGFTISHKMKYLRSWV